jgi:hypothetical protein
MVRATLKQSILAGMTLMCCLWFVRMSAQTPAAGQFPDGPGKSTFIKVCTQCHDVDKVAGLRYSRDEWQSLVDEMRSMGGDATDDEWKTVVEYLATNFPRE